MKKFILAAMVAALTLGAFSVGARAETIEVNGLGPETLNFETQGIITFEATSLTIICNKTTRGHLNTVSTGTLGLLRNEAGFISEIILNGCEQAGSQGRATGLARTERPETWTRLSWIRAPRRGEADSTAILAGNNALFLIEVAGLASCLYSGELMGTGRANAEGKYTTLTLALLESRSLRLVRRLAGILCPSSATITGSLRVTKPVGGAGPVILTP